VRFGPGTALTFHDPIQADYRLKSGDMVYLDLGPIWADAETGLEYEGDVGDSFVLGTNKEAEKCASSARSLWKEAQAEWKKGAKTGKELYAFLKKRAAESGYEFVEKVQGHRLSDFPHTKYSKSTLAVTPFYPTEALWILEFQINDRAGRFGAFYED